MMKKAFLFFIFLILCDKAFAAGPYYAINTGTNLAWNSSSTWASSSNQATGGAGVPAVGDTVYLDGSSTSVALASTTDTCATVIMTGYTNNFTFTAGDTLTVAGNVILPSGTGGTISGTGTLKITGTGTLTPNNVTTFTGSINFAYAGNYTLGANLSVAGLTTFSAATNLLTNTLTMNAGLTLSSNAGTTPTTNLILTGGAWTGNFILYNNLTINQTTSNVTTTSTKYATGTLAYNSSGVGSYTVTPSGTLTLSACTLNTNGITWATVYFSNITVVLSSDLQVTTLNFGFSVTFTGVHNITAATMSFVSPSYTFTFPAGMTINITSVITSMVSETFVSGTPSSPVYINFTGNYSTCNISGSIFTDMQSIGKTLFNFYGGTLTRTTGITNATGANFVSSPPIDIFGAIE